MEKSSSKILLDKRTISHIEENLPSKLKGGDYTTKDYPHSVSTSGNHLDVPAPEIQKQWLSIKH